MSTAVIQTPSRFIHAQRRRIDVRDVRRVLEEIARADPEHADPRVTDGLQPRYIHQGQPNCLVAHVLTRLGFARGVIAALDTEFPVGELVDPGVRITESRHPALRKITPAALRLLQFVQDTQNRGQRWGRIAKIAFARTVIASRWDRNRRPWLY